MTLDKLKAQACFLQVVAEYETRLSCANDQHIKCRHSLFLSIRTPFGLFAYWPGRPHISLRTVPKMTRRLSRQPLATHTINADDAPAYDATSVGTTGVQGTTRTRVSPRSRTLAI